MKVAKNPSWQVKYVLDQQWKSHLTSLVRDFYPDINWFCMSSCFSALLSNLSVRSAFGPAGRRTFFLSSSRCVCCRGGHLRDNKLAPRIWHTFCMLRYWPRNSIDQTHTHTIGSSKYIRCRHSAGHLNSARMDAQRAEMRPKNSSSLRASIAFYPSHALCFLYIRSSMANWISGTNTGPPNLEIICQ